MQQVPAPGAPKRTQKTPRRQPRRTRPPPSPCAREWGHARPDGRRRL